MNEKNNRCHQNNENVLAISHCVTYQLIHDTRSTNVLAIYTTQNTHSYTPKLLQLTNRFFTLWISLTFLIFIFLVDLATICFVWCVKLVCGKTYIFSTFRSFLVRHISFVFCLRLNSLFFFCELLHLYNGTLLRRMRKIQDRTLTI